MYLCGGLKRETGICHWYKVRRNRKNFVTKEASDMNEEEMKEANFIVQKNLLEYPTYIPIEYERWKELEQFYKNIF